MALQKAEKGVSHHVDSDPRNVNGGLAPEPNPEPWYKQPELRKLYVCLGFLFLASSTLGYDGSLLNGMQTMDSWQICK